MKKIAALVLVIVGFCSFLVLEEEATAETDFSLPRGIYATTIQGDCSVDAIQIHENGFEVIEDGIALGRHSFDFTHSISAKGRDGYTTVGVISPGDDQHLIIALTSLLTEADSLSLPSALGSLHAYVTTGDTPTKHMVSNIVWSEDSERSHALFRCE